MDRKNSGQSPSEANATPKKGRSFLKLGIILGVCVSAALGGYLWMMKSGGHDSHGSEGEEAAEGHSEHGKAEGHEDSKHHESAEGHSEHGKAEGHEDSKHHESAEGHAKQEKHEKEESHGNSHASGEHASGGHEAAEGHGQEWSLADTYGDAFLSIQNKVRDLHLAQEENRRLRLENMNLKHWAEALKFDCSSDRSDQKTRDLRFKLSKETGSGVGRALASIQYQPPTHLLPPQLFVLAVSYLKAKEYEKAAVILTFLTRLEDSEAMKTPRNFVLTGLAWYFLDHWNLADHYFELALKTPVQKGKEKSQLRYQAQARLWMAVTAERHKDRAKSQQWLRELVSNHPHSREAGWINGEEPNRRPASHESDSEENEGEEEEEGHSSSHHSQDSHAPAAGQGHGEHQAASVDRHTSDHADDTEDF